MLRGRRFRYVGLNYYYGNDRNNMPNGGYSAGEDDDVMSKDLSGLNQSIGSRDKVLRIWFFQRQATVNGQRDWSAFDHTLQVAAAYGYKVIPVLTDEYDYTEGPFKGITFYQSGYKTDVWSTSTTDYLDYVKQVVARYKNNPTIMAWQLINEGKADSTVDGSCPDENAGFKALYGFVSTVTTAIHQIDHNHLISNGLLYNNCGTHAGTGHYATLANLPYNDLYELHDYSGPSVAVSADASYIFGAAKAANRPAIVGEVGLPRALGLTTRASDYNAKLSAWWRQPAVAGVTAWVWNGEPQYGTVDRIFDISPGDPTLTVLARYGSRAY